MDTGLPDDRLKSLLAAIERIYQPVEAPLFARHLLNVIGDLLPDTFQAVHFIDHETGVVESELGTNIRDPEKVRVAVGKFVMQNPSAAYVHAGGTETVIQPTDFVSQREFRRTDLYNEAYRPLEIEWEINVALAAPGKTSGLSVNRGGQRNFAEKDRHLLRLIRPHIIGAYANAQLYGSLKRNVSERAPSHETLNAGRLSRQGLTARQIEVLQWISEGKRDSEIAIILGIGRRTVHTHVGQILTKLGVETRTGAVYAACEKTRTVRI